MRRLYFWAFVLVTAPACNKFLNKPANASLPSPTTVADFQAMMDQSSLTTWVTPGLGPVYVEDYRWAAAASGFADSFSLGVYTWQPALFASVIEASWSHPYAAIYTCNTVLANLPQLDRLDSADAVAARFVMGQAFFLRAFMYYHLAETFGQPYRPATASTDMGVPLRINENVMANAPRASMLAVYQQIISDLGRAIPRLPAALQAANRNRPCRGAAYGLLARVWLTCQDYVKAQLYADSSLMSYDSLIDFNALDSTSLHPFSASGNSEVLFQCTALNYPLQYGRSVLIDSALYNSYSPDDLRRVVFFQPVTSGMMAGNHYFKGEYSGLAYLFSGIAVDEIYFISAESKAWNGDLDGALSDVNTLLAKRWRSGRFLPYSAAGLTRDSVLHFVLAEKRKETVFREVRFYDLRRLNQYPAFAVTLSRVYGGQAFSLLPGSPRYAFPIPQQEIDLSGVVQNPD
ncbi:MAG TPA: RagB/SusD family nutrient uptake outer membrane protein [Puia sp.]|nr:RagB/SusD family nutrient uptake outer membrane protein [Puia sp.]